MSVSYSRINFKDRRVARPRTYTITENADGSVTLVPAPGEIEEAGTPLNGRNMNALDKGLNDCARAVNDLLERVKMFTATIPAEGWTAQENGAYYTIDVAVQGILPSDTPDIDIVQTGVWATDESIRFAWASVTRITTGENVLHVTADSLPGWEMPIQVRCVRHG